MMASSPTASAMQRLMYSGLMALSFAALSPSAVQRARMAVRSSPSLRRRGANAGLSCARVVPSAAARAVSAVAVSAVMARSQGKLRIG